MLGASGTIGTQQQSARSAALRPRTGTPGHGSASTGTGRAGYGAFAGYEPVTAGWNSHVAKPLRCQFGPYAGLTTVKCLVTGHAGSNSFQFKNDDFIRCAFYDLGAQVPTGTVRVGFPHSVGNLLIGKTVARYRALYSDVLVSLSEGYNHMLLEWMLSDRLDVAVMTEFQDHPLLESRPLFEEGLVLRREVDHRPRTTRYWRRDPTERRSRSSTLVGRMRKLKT